MWCDLRTHLHSPVSLYFSEVSQMDPTGCNVPKFCSVFSYRPKNFQVVLSSLRGSPDFRYVVDTQEFCPGADPTRHLLSSLILPPYPPITITRAPITASWWLLHLTYLLTTSPRQGAGSMRTWLVPNHTGTMYTVGKCLPADRWTE